MYTKKKVKCIECGKEFIFEAWEQEVYKTKNKLDYGKYCLTCRVKNGCNLTDECNNVRECLNRLTNFSHNCLFV